MITDVCKSLFTVAEDDSIINVIDEYSQHLVYPPSRLGWK